MHRNLPFVSTALLLGALAAILLMPTTSVARDDVPEEIAQRQNPVTLDPGRIAYFAKQFKAKCARCHGLEGDGAGAESAAQAFAPANFTDAAYMSTRTDGQLFYQILMGGKRSAMPAFGPDSDYGWSEEKIWGMVAYVRSFAEPAGK